MRIVRCVVLGLVAGAVAGLLGALLRPRRLGAVSGYSPVGSDPTR